MSGIVGASGQGEEEEKNKQQLQRSRLVARLLAASPDLPSFLHDLITTQAVVVAGTEAAAFTITRGEQAGFILNVAAHVRPDGAAEDVRQQALNAFKELVFPCVQQSRDGAIEIAAAEGSDEGQYCLVTLLRDENNIVAVSAVITRCRDVERAQQRLVSMQLVAGYFDLYNLRRKSEQSLQLAASHQDVLQYSTAVGTAENFAQSAANLCNALATRTGSVRVSLGWLKGTGIKVKALSHTENFDKRQELIQLIQQVMEEAADQDEPVYYNPTPEIGEPSTQNVTREATAFSRSQGGNSVLSVPLRKAGELVGVLTLEFPPKTALPAGAVAGMTVAGDVLAPQLEDRYQNDRWLITKAALSTKWLGEQIVGPKHMLAKLVCSIILCLVLFVSLYSPMYRVAGTFSFVSTEKRTLTVPYDGYLGAIGQIDGRDIKAGMRVSAGTPLVSMDISEVQQNLIAKRNESLAALREATKAQAEGKQADAMIARSRAEQADAYVALYQSQIDRGVLKSPIDGYVTRNDAEDRRGSQVKGGEALFEVAQIDKLRIEIHVPERDVQMIKVGSTGEIATNSLPGETYPFTVTRIVPQGQAKDGTNVFTVIGELDTTHRPEWLPGREGIAKIDTEKRSLLHAWTFRFVDMVRLKVWSWF